MIVETEHDEGQPEHPLGDADPDETCLAPSPEDCLWPLGTDTFTTQSYVLTDPDAIGYPAGRSFSVLVYTPQSTPGPLPVVIVSHGGDVGIDNPANALPRWGLTLAEAGYLTIAIAHNRRSPALEQAMCAARGIPASTCGGGLAWDRPHDVSTVIDFVEAQAQGPWAGLADTENIGIVGFSAGANASLMMGGMIRDFGAGPETLSDERIRAIAAMSPAGPGGIGIGPGAWDQIEVPVFLATGAFDIDDGIANRETAFYAMPDFQKYLLYHQDPGAVHGLFSLNLGACRQVTTQARCQDLANWTRTSVLAFLAQSLRDDEDADHWLSTDSISVASGGDVTLTKRHSGHGSGHGNGHGH